MLSEVERMLRRQSGCFGGRADTIGSYGAEVVGIN